MPLKVRSLTLFSSRARIPALSLTACSDLPRRWVEIQLATVWRAKYLDNSPDCLWLSFEHQKLLGKSHKFPPPRCIRIITSIILPYCMPPASGMRRKIRKKILVNFSDRKRSALLHAVPGALPRIDSTIGKGRANPRGSMVHPPLLNLSYSCRKHNRNVHITAKIGGWNPHEERASCTSTINSSLHLQN